MFAHGAGAGMNHPFMQRAAEALEARGIATRRFDFPYMQQRRRVPDRQPVLEACYAKVIAGTREAFPSAREHLF